jgi:hypothetical protein
MASPFDHVPMMMAALRSTRGPRVSAPAYGVTNAEYESSAKPRL